MGTHNNSRISRFDSVPLSLCRTISAASNKHAPANSFSVTLHSLLSCVPNRTGPTGSGQDHTVPANPPRVCARSRPKMLLDFTLPASHGQRKTLRCIKCLHDCRNAAGNSHVVVCGTLPIRLASRLEAPPRRVSESRATTPPSNGPRAIIRARASRSAGWRLGGTVTAYHSGKYGFHGYIDITLPAQQVR